MASGFIVTTVLLLSSAGLTAANALRGRCVDPPNMAEMLATLTPSSEYSLQDSQLSSIVASQSTVCPTHITDDGPINERSTCPWYLQAESDPSRYPNIVMKAQLKCGRYCRKIRHRHGRRRLEADRSGTCQPISDAIHVLRYTGCDPVTGFKKYSVVTENKTVAYTCVFKR